MGFTPHKVYRRSDKATQECLEKTYTYTQKRATNFNVEIFWGGKAGVNNQYKHARGYVPKVHTAVIKTQAKRLRINLISEVNNRGRLRFMRRLIKDAKRKVFLVLDNLHVHHSKLVKAWLEKYKEQIEASFLPLYTLGLNSDEYLNGGLKQHIKASSPAKTQTQLEKRYSVICEESKRYLNELWIMFSTH